MTNVRVELRRNKTLFPHGDYSYVGLASFLCGANKRGQIKATNKQQSDGNKSYRKNTKGRKREEK